MQGTNFCWNAGWLHGILLAEHQSLKSKYALCNRVCTGSSTVPQRPVWSNTCLRLEISKRLNHAFVVFFHSGPCLPRLIHLFNMKWPVRFGYVLGIYISSQSSPKRFRCQDTSPHRWWCTECLNAMCASGTSVWPVDGIFGVRSKGLVAGQRGLWKTWVGDTIYRYWTHLDGIKIHHVDSLYIPICCTCACAYAISKKTRGSMPICGTDLFKGSRSWRKN